MVADRDERPSYEELAALVVERARVIGDLRARVTALEAENVELRRRVGTNSSNSSHPPSSDGLAKPTRKSLRGKTNRKLTGNPVIRSYLATAAEHGIGFLHVLTDTFRAAPGSPH